MQYLDFKGISKYECYQKTGITNGVLSKKEGLSEDNLLRFISYFSDISTDWLLLGFGQMLRSEQAEQLHEPTIVYKRDPKDAEIIAAKDLIIKRDAELIALLQDRIRNFEMTKTPYTSDLDIARSADITTITGTKSIHK